MSAIAGVVLLDDNLDCAALVHVLTAAMTQRGPDARGHWVSGNVALGHCMLRTTPESLDETQPLSSEDDRFVIVMDGRLDNREELRRHLQLKGWNLRSRTDAELVLRAYQAWGVDSPIHLLGDFAYAVWDRHRQCLFCARDHLGARPFYYAKTANYIAFASADDALPGLPGISGLPNEERIADLLAPGIETTNAPRSWLRDVWALWPGESMTVGADGAASTSTYWHPEPGDESVYASDAECEEAFLAVFREAVSCRLRSLSSPAAMMSGGMDSASISAMVRSLSPGLQSEQFHTYSALSDDPNSCVESRCIQRLTSGSEVRASFLSVPSMRGMLGLDELIDTMWSHAHPVDNSIVLPAMMCRAAGAQGDRVLLHGASGDLTLDTPTFYAAYHMQTGQWLQAWRECRAAVRNHTYLLGSSPVQLLLRNALICYAPDRLRMFARRWRMRHRGIAPQGSVINPDFANRLGLIERWNADQALASPTTMTAMRQSLAQTVFRHPGLVSGLSAYERVAGRYGVELRDPWADRRVVDFFLRLPLHYKVRHGWTKYLVRSAFARELPAEVRWRRGKEHLGWSMTCRLMDETHEFVIRTLETGLESVSKYVNTDVVRFTIKNYNLCKNDTDRALLYNLTTLILWLRR